MTITITEYDAYNAGLNYSDLLNARGEYILIEYSDVNKGTTWHSLRPYTGVGVGGNMDSSVKRLHGWRGTTNDRSVYACGVHKITNARPLKTQDAVRLTLGPDLYPDEP